MMKKTHDGTDELLQRAREEPPEREHRYVYGGSASRPASGFAVRPNRKGMVRKVSTFYVIVALLCFGVSTVAYVNNVIVVNRLATEINQMQASYDKISNENALLRSEINRKSAWERIGKIAGEQIGLRYAKTPPTLFDVDQDLLDRAQKTQATR